MTNLADNDLLTLQHEVQQLLGRCLLRLQHYELLIKAIVAHHKLSGPINDMERSRSGRVDATARKTLGTLVGDLLGSYVVAGEIEPPEGSPISPPEGLNSFVMQLSLNLSSEDFARVERDLRDMVRLRNNLVHHFIEQHNLRSLDGCRCAQDALVSANNRIDQNLNQLREWAGTMEEMHRVLSLILQSEEFKTEFTNRVTSKTKVGFDTSGIACALREAYCALAVDGWAPVTEAGRWVAERYPEEKPAKYGCQNWREVVLKAPTLEIRYLELNGHRTPCYRECDITLEWR